MSSGPPPPIVSVAQRRYPAQSCGVCGRRLASNLPTSTPCPFCGKTARDYQIGFEASLSFTGQLDTMRAFYRTYPEWAFVQVFLLIAAPLEGFAAGMAVGGATGQVVGAVIGLIFGVIGAFYLPPWREPVEEHRSTLP